MIADTKAELRDACNIIGRRSKKVIDQAGYETVILEGWRGNLFKGKGRSLNAG